MVRILRQCLGFIGLIALSYLLFTPVDLPAAVAAQSPLGRMVWRGEQAIVQSWETGIRILIVILCSTLLRETSRPGELVRGLRQLHVPDTIALALETTLALLQPAERERGGGRSARGVRRGLSRLLRPDITSLAAQVQAAIQRARAHAAASSSSGNVRLISDVAVVSGVAVLMMTVRFMKILPGIPFAPGHKLIALIPLYVVARRLTISRWGATLTGVTVGTMAFLFGEGRFGIFEIIKHAAPGPVVDALTPVGGPSATPKRIIVYSIIGLLAGLASFAATAAVALLFRAPTSTLALLAPFGLSQAVFGAASGPITYALTISIDRLHLHNPHDKQHLIEKGTSCQRAPEETACPDGTTSRPD